MQSFALGESIPPDTTHVSAMLWLARRAAMRAPRLIFLAPHPHDLADRAKAVSVSLPTWQSNVAYEEGEDWVIGRLTTGYPRFFIHKSVDALATDIATAYAEPNLRAMLFPTPRAAARCLDFVKRRAEAHSPPKLHAVHLVLDESENVSSLLRKLSPTISAIFVPAELFPLAKQYWQHTGDGVSSRQAEFCHDLFREHLLVPISDRRSTCNPPVPSLRGPRRYQRQQSMDAAAAQTTTKPQLGAKRLEDSQESSRFLEERFGRNLDLTLVARAKSAIQRRIAGSLVHDVDLRKSPLPPMASSTRGVRSLGEEDVYLFPAGMNAIFNAHRALLSARGPLKSISFGFPYVDTLKILQKFGPGCVFYGHASSADLDELEGLLRSGQRFLALFCEFPGNPTLASPDLERIRRLADEFDFALVVDDTIGTFANVNILPVADVVVSSLTKIFSGASNVMGGSAILNPEGKYYSSLKKALDEDVYEDTYWPEDVIFMERNSRDFAARVDRINANAEAICAILRDHPLVQSVHYPKHNASKEHYDAHRLPHGGYGGLLSVVFTHRKHAQVFYDAMESAKGPSLGTNFTLCSPYVLLAHYQELSWAAKFGVDADLVRVSVGLEEPDVLQAAFRKALQAANAASG
ncbi:hypothetical protein DCS_01879 [Drechmeria coniospora]|uniref:cystathionine gamma-synthase n=1 Tax=Drechmeria coniospora TaxID=98403 RepID=A0A151GUJ4_DRECN|nr:hypothetical protein DCS_01879 [Drechmeria coniospora]KYK60741.1 hypothetical protein DCS_01879 [Drechmeria coniospora]ODA83428.1 hypothetical protein RJ55_01942 [Drechmeria coniospora]